MTVLLGVLVALTTIAIIAGATMLVRRPPTGRSVRRPEPERGLGTEARTTRQCPECGSAHVRSVGADEAWTCTMCGASWAVEDGVWPDVHLQLRHHRPLSDQKPRTT